MLTGSATHSAWRDFRSSRDIRHRAGSRGGNTSDKLSALGRVLKREKAVTSPHKARRSAAAPPRAAAMHFAPALRGALPFDSSHCDLFNVSFYDCHNSFSSLPRVPLPRRLRFVHLFLFMPTLYDGAPRHCRSRNSFFLSASPSFFPAI